MLEYFRDQGKSLLGIIASEIFNLRKYLFIVERQQLVEEDGCIVSICLSKMSYMGYVILRV